MKRHMNDEQHNRHLEQPRTGLLRQEFTSFEHQDNKIVKRTITRTYLGTDRYTDSQVTEVIYHE